MVVPTATRVFSWSTGADLLLSSGIYHSPKAIFQHLQQIAQFRLTPFPPFPSQRLSLAFASITGGALGPQNLKS
jgi:hypothetical protein